MSLRDKQNSLYSRGRLQEAQLHANGHQTNPLGPRTDHALEHMAHISVSNHLKRAPTSVVQGQQRATTPNRSGTNTSSTQSPRPFPTAAAVNHRHQSPHGGIAAVSSSDVRNNNSPFRDVYRGSIHTNHAVNNNNALRHASPHHADSNTMSQLYSPHTHSGTTAMTRLRDVSSTHEGRVMATVRRRAEQVISRYQRLHYISEEDARSLEYCKNHCEAFMGNVESSLRLGVTANEVMEQSAVRQAFEQWQSCNHLVTRAQLVINAHAEKSALSGSKGGRSGGNGSKLLGSTSQGSMTFNAPSHHQHDHHHLDDGHPSYVQRSLSPFQTNQSDLGGVGGFGAGGETPRSHSPYGRTGSNHSRPDTIASRSTAAPSATTTNRGGGLSRGDLQQGVAELRALQQLKNHDGDSAARTYELCCMVYGAERGHVEFVSWMSLLPTDVMNTVAECVLGTNHPNRSSTRVAADGY